ncbi:hypothetical protein GCM10010201_09680 [Pilimelia columellifera subsp. columellifera]|uniref:glycerophosphodiester phosphodiesterase n=1 Tax=Pilimelia columellifera subsp. columellifera TaxID=706583 RepID=A0ABN3NAG6_9ACTN
MGMGAAVTATTPAGASAARQTAATAASPEAVAARGPLVIGHRGASGYRTEHTLASYELAARMGADFIEPDLVITADRVLVARHEPEISGTTDVATRPEFDSRRKTVSLDGATVTGWFVEDFALAELKTLRAVERLPEVRQRNTLYDGRFTVPTFAEILHLRARLSRELGRQIGVYPETKHPTYFKRLGLSLEERLVDDLRANGLDRRQAPVFVQSFEAANLRRLRHDLGLRARTVFLTAASGGPFADPSDAAGRRRPPRRTAGPPVHVPGREPVPARRPAGRRRPVRLRQGHRRAAHVPARRS